MTKPSPEDLLDAVVAADDLRRKARGEPSTRAALALGRHRPTASRTFVEPLFNVLGHLWAYGMISMPSPWRRSFVQWVNCKMGGYTPPASLDLSSRMGETVKLARDLKKQTGQWPAFLVLTSHPNTEGPQQWLRFELLRQGLQIADAVVEAMHPGAWYPPHPKCFLAIDPYALDTVSAPIGGFYSAWMHRIYLAWDRQPSTQSWFQRHWLLRNSDYSHIVWRLLRTLKADTPVLMALGGGLPYNARLLYSAREFVHHLPVARWNLHRREAHIELMNILMKPVGRVWPAENGDLPAETLQAVREAMRRWGLYKEQESQAIAELEEEFKLSVPYRERLFRVLMNRFVSRGKPLLLLVISHRDTAPHVRIAAPVAVSKVPSDIAAFARDFVRTNF